MFPFTILCYTSRLIFWFSIKNEILYKTKSSISDNNHLASFGFVDHGMISLAEQAGIKLDLGQNKIENLIKLASKNSK